MKTAKHNLKCVTSVGSISSGSQLYAVKAPLITCAFRWYMAITIILVALCILPAGCRSQWSSRHSYSLKYDSRGRDCGITHLEKAPHGEYVVLGIVEAGMSAHFSKGRASLSKVLPLLRAEACLLGANAILDMKTKFTVRQDYTEVHVKAKAVAVSRTFSIPSSRDQKKYTEAWLSLSKAAESVRSCVRAPAAILVHTDVRGIPARVEPLDPAVMQDETLLCIRRETKTLSLPNDFGFHSFLLVIQPRGPETKPPAKETVDGSAQGAQKKSEPSDTETNETDGTTQPPDEELNETDGTTQPPKDSDNSGDTSGKSKGGP